MASTTQDDVEYIAKNLDVKYDVLTNSPDKYSAKITLTNIGNEHIKRTIDWKIYFYSFRKVDNVLVSDNYAFSLEGINGLLCCLSPTANFTGLQPKQNVELVYQAAGANVARSDNLPNWYVVAPNTKAAVLQSTLGVDASFVSHFDSPEKWKRKPEDMYNPWKPAERFDKNKMEDLGKAPNPILPTPKDFTIDEKEGSIVMDKSKWVVVAESTVKAEAGYVSCTFEIIKWQTDKAKSDSLGATKFVRREMMRSRFAPIAPWFPHLHRSFEECLFSICRFSH